MKSVGSSHPAAADPGTRVPSTPRPPCSVVTAKRPVAACRCAASSRQRDRGGRRQSDRARGAAPVAPAKTRRGKCGQQHHDEHLLADRRRPRQTEGRRRSGYPFEPGSRRTRDGQAASATAGSRTQLSWATTPEKKICPGHNASARPAAMRQRNARIGRQIRNGRSGVSPVSDGGRDARRVRGAVRHDAKEHRQQQRQSGVELHPVPSGYEEAFVAQAQAERDEAGKVREGLRRKRGAEPEAQAHAERQQQRRALEIAPLPLCHGAILGSRGCQSNPADAPLARRGGGGTPSASRRPRPAARPGSRSRPSCLRAPASAPPRGRPPWERRR